MSAKAKKVEWPKIETAMWAVTMVSLLAAIVGYVVGWKYAEFCLFLGFGIDAILGSIRLGRVMSESAKQ